MTTSRSTSEDTLRKAGLHTNYCPAHRGAAKSGKTVLHLDQAGQYGSAWSSLTLDDFLTWARQQEELTGLENTQLPDKEGTAEAIDAQDFLHIKFGLAEESLYSNIRLYQQPIDLGSSRHFSLDLAGKAGCPPT